MQKLLPFVFVLLLQLVCGANNTQNLNPKVFSEETTSEFCIHSEASTDFQSSHLLALPLSLFSRPLVTSQSARLNQRYEFVHPHVNEELRLPTRLSSDTMPMFQLMPADFQTTCAFNTPLPPTYPPSLHTHTPPPAAQLMNKSPGYLNLPWTGGGDPSFSGRKIVASSSEVLESNWTALYSFADQKS